MCTVFTSNVINSFLNVLNVHRGVLRCSKWHMFVLFHVFFSQMPAASNNRKTSQNLRKNIFSINFLNLLARVSGIFTQSNVETGRSHVFFNVLSFVG